MVDPSTVILTAHDVATRWHVHPVTVQRLCVRLEHTDRPLGFRAGRCWRIPLKNLLAYEHQGEGGE